MENITILFVDDEVEIRLAMETIFESQGWKGLLAADVEEALMLTDHSEPDIVIMDYHLPKIDGITGTRLLRHRLPETPIIIFTIEDSQEVADKFLDAGASDFASKPLRAADIIARIRLHIRMLEQKNAQSAYYIEKSISSVTLNLITDYMDPEEAYTVEEISTGTGLAYQTVYRYLQYMQEKGNVIVEQSYGKIGRPKRRFRRRVL